MTLKAVSSTGGSSASSGSLSAVAARRQANIANFLKGPQIPAPAWAASTAYVTNNVVTVGGGQHLVCTAGGTSAATIPTYGLTALTGRPLTDGSVSWVGLPIVQTLTDPNAPTTTYGATPGALGLTQVIPVTAGGVSGAGPNPNAKLTGWGAFLYGDVYSMAGYFAATGLTAGGGNVTSVAVAAGQASGYGYNLYEYEYEVYITDSYFGLNMANVSNPISIEVDGVLVTPSGLLSAGAYNNTFGYNYNGVVKRRLVRVPCGTLSNLVTALALSPIGFLEVADTPKDDLLLLGDSICFTVTGGGGNMTRAFGGYLRRFLGFSGVWNAGVGGAGYVSANTNTFNLPALLANSQNIINFQALNPAHVLIETGCNDVGNAVGVAGVCAAALGCWQTLRAMLPSAKITITDGFPNATGPSAAAITQAVAMQAQFTAWGDANSRFIQSTSASAATAWTQGTTNAGQAIPSTPSNTCDFISTDGTHPTTVGAWYYGYRAAQAIIAAWNGAY